MLHLKFLQVEFSNYSLQIIFPFSQTRKIISQTISIPPFHFSFHDQKSRFHFIVPVIRTRIHRQFNIFNVKIIKMHSHKNDIQTQIPPLQVVGSTSCGLKFAKPCDFQPWMWYQESKISTQIWNLNKSKFSSESQKMFVRN